VREPDFSNCQRLEYYEITNPFSDGHENFVRILIHTKPVEALNKSSNGGDQKPF
jgi:hypothetical protein